MNRPALRRGACPGLLDAMPTGDGLLARLPQAAAFALADFIAICRAAAVHGNGLMEVTARGSLQARGLTPASAGAFALACREAGVAEAGGPPVIASPLGASGRGALADASGLVAALRTAMPAYAGRIAPKVALAVDDGAAPHLDGVSADIRLRALDGGRFLLGLAGDGRSATWLGAVTAGDALAATMALLDAIAGIGPHARARDLRDAGAIAGPWSRPAPALPRRSPATFVGTHDLADGRVAVGVGLAFGQAEAGLLATLAEVAADAGARAIVPAPERTLIVTGLSAGRAAGFARAAARIGFVTEPDDLRRRVVACAGAPGCAAALIPARGIAEAVARVARPLLAAGGNIHLSGCAKGCASRGRASLTLVGTEAGVAIIRDGGVGDRPDTIVPASGLVERIERLAELEPA